ncbi:hypothetical protein HMPREF9186_01332 [Streptococcus sp. F0442]|uniref:HEPN domain-containing protein n=1 Tax=Streptococcus sp. F0442 TaxID=999425 RepID=UPI0002994DA2|nr:HEPN domain-containing protein [Streptococcus sp. F0442]EKS17564.1 hypothetical protein HMPREF9186_01332 [Streptococcus sp. F0442]
MNDDEKRVLEDCNLEIQRIKNWINNNKLDSNVKFLVSYAVIKASGSIELVFKSMINTFLSQNCIDETKVFLTKNIIDNSANPSPGNIEKHLEQFDGRRKEKFSNLLKDSQDKGNLKSLVALRNDIAHGRTINSSINIVESYFKSGKKILETLEVVINDSADIL